VNNVKCTPNEELNIIPDEKYIKNTTTFAAYISFVFAMEAITLWLTP